MSISETIPDFEEYRKNFPQQVIDNLLEQITKQSLEIRKLNKIISALDDDCE